jgi:tetratricopeptide (TPR) repeat protein
LKFEAAGVRGLIDPGGYSAPANAAAATVLIKGIADIKRGARDQGAAAAAAALPCGLGPELRAAEQANPGSAAAKQKLGNFYVAHDETEKGIALLEQAQALERSEAAIALDLATARIRNGEFDAARQLLKGLEPRMRSDAVLHQLLARADEGSGMFREAAAEYQAAAQEQPSEDYLFGVGYEFILAGLPADATSAFRSGLQGHPDSVELLIGEGSAEFLQGKTSEGIAHFLRATEINPADPRAYVFLASVAEIRRPESDKIRDSFRRFLDVAPDNVDASYDYALSLWVARDANTPLTDDVKNEELLKRAIQLSPSFAKAHFRLGTLYFERGDYPGAVREYEATVRLAPAMKEAHYRLANAYQRIGQSEGAAREMRLFQAAQDQQRQEAAAGISIQQFVSVLTPARETTSSKLSCTEPLR